MCMPNYCLMTTTGSLILQVASDEVPKDWLPPYKGEGTGNSLFWPDSARRAVSKSALPPKREGMQQVVSSRRAG